MTLRATVRQRKTKAAGSAAGGRGLSSAQYLVGGVNSPVRTFRAVGAQPVWLTQGRGAEVTDVHDARFLDLIMGWGALILGHRHPAVMRAVRAQLNRSTLLGLTSPVEMALAQAISEAIPSIEQVRFMPSGTEACMTAIRLARGATNRSKVLTFEGCYHGHSDGLLAKRGSGLATLGLAKSAGVPEAIVSETVVVPYHDLEALELAVREFGPQLACAIVEPIAANMGVVVPDRAFLQRLRSLADRAGFVLIFDEVVTGFRAAYGGAQTLLGIRPDLTILGKIIGGGFPIGAVGGPRRLMQCLAPEGPVYHAGTFAGHPVSMAAGLATLQELKRRQPYHILDAMGRQVAEGIRAGAKQAGHQVQVNQYGSMLTVFFSGAPVQRFSDVQQADTARFRQLANALREQGILIPPSPFEAMFLSTAHQGRALTRIMDAFTGVLQQMGAA